MKKVIQIAIREFVSTVSTKGFIAGVVIFPAIMLGAVTLIPMLMKDTAPPVDGTLAVIDRSGGEAARAIEKSFRQAQADAAAVAAESGQVGESPVRFAVRVESLGASADIESAKTGLLEGSARDGGRLAVVVVNEHAVRPDPESDNAYTFEGYDWYVRQKLDDRAQDRIRDAVRDAIIDARMAANGEDPERLAALTRLRVGESKTVTGDGEISTSADEALNVLLPIGFMMLLWASVFTGGQYLLTTTIEEKSSRVMEVLLSAASPMELMTGKIIGQMSVGLVILAVYAALGAGSLSAFSLLNALEWQDLGLLIVFFFIAFFIIAALMAAIGSAVNEMREAQALMGPIMIVLIIPLMLWLPISRDPNGTLATVLSFIPPVSPFVMILRMTSSEPIPLWEIAASILVGIAAVYIFVKIAAKVFRIGVLMYGKPPDLKTLVRWIRMA